MEIPFLEIFTVVKFPEYTNTISVVVIPEILNDVKFGNVLFVMVDVIPAPANPNGITMYV